MASIMFVRAVPEPRFFPNAPPVLWLLSHFWVQEKVTLEGRGPDFLNNFPEDLCNSAQKCRGINAPGGELQQ